jgi:DNA-binding CsgD family transcriptional regulator
MGVEAWRGDPQLLEREAELELLGGLVAGVGVGEGALVVVEGQAGVGKTSLLGAAARLGRADGLRVLRGRGSELDRAFAFGLVRQLFEVEVSSEPELLTGGAEAASGVFGRAVGDGRGEDGLFGSLQGLYWLVSNLGARRPLVLLVDDVHWADTASLRWLVFLADRLEDVPALVLAATRPDEPGADEELIEALAATSGARVLRPAPLSASSTRAVVRERLPEAVDAFGEACHRATGGNPFLLGELLDELAAAGVRGAATEAGQVLEFGSQRVGRAVRRRLRLLAVEATAVARAVAVLGPGAPVADAAALVEVDEAAAARAADDLAGINVLAVDGGLDFVHPVLRGAVYEQIPPLERQALHLKAAGLLKERGAESERVARHLLRLPPAGNRGCVAVLRAAGREASARGAAEAASRYLRRALEEPPAPDERSAVLHELGFAEATDRQRDRFEAHLREAMAVTSDPQSRARIALDLGFAFVSNGEFRAAVDVLEGGLRDLDDPDAELSVALEAELLASATVDFTAAEISSRHLERRFDQLRAGEQLAPATLACLAAVSARSRPPAADAIRLAERALELSRFDEPSSVLGASVGLSLAWAGAAAKAGPLFDQLTATATRRGSRQTIFWLFLLRSDASLRLGEIRRAEAEARSALELAIEGTGEPGLAWTVAHLLNALVARGALEDAEALASHHVAGPGAPPTLGLALLLTAQANLHLAQGRPGPALKDARAAGDLVSPTIFNPRCCDWRSPAALALGALGRDAEAREVADSELAAARRFAIADAEGAALRTLGLVAGGDEGLEALRESVAVLEGAESGLEHARSLLELGAALRRAGERVEARGVLREALDATSRLGASGLADRAHAELVAAGARPRRDRRLLSGPESLTASEDRVAALAAEGLTNREIAQRLFVTVKAVQWHLGNVYRKLDISSREELPQALGLAPQDKTLGRGG